MMSSTSITRVLHTATWNYFTSYLPDHFDNSPEVVKEVMTDINGLVREFSRTSSDEESLLAMRRLFGILQKCSDNVCINIVSVLRLPSTSSTDVLAAAIQSQI
jgi:hypothetical protein